MIYDFDGLALLNERCACLCLCVDLNYSNDAPAITAGTSNFHWKLLYKLHELRIISDHSLRWIVVVVAAAAVAAAAACDMLCKV